MFLLEVTKAGGRGNTPDKIDAQVINDRGLRVCFRPGNYCGFSFRIDNKLVLGEANLPVKLTDIESALELLKVSDHPDKALGNDILNLLVLDFEQRSLTLANSISNSRPFLYWKNADKIVCATSYRPMESCGVRLELNEEAVPEFMAYRQVFPPRTIYSGIKRSIVGQVMTFCLKDFEIKNDVRWKIDRLSRSNGKITTDDHLDRVDEILRKGMTEQLNQGRTSKVLLSGGNDSSLLAFLGKSIDPKITSTSTSFSFLNRQDKEVRYATSAAEHIGIDHTVNSFTSEEYLRAVVESIHLNEEPIDHLQTALLYMVYRRQEETEKVLYINGLGADLVFGDHLQKDIYSQTGLLNFIRYSGMRPIIKLVCDLFNIKHPRCLFLAQDFAPKSRSESHVLWSILRAADPQDVRKHFGFNGRSVLGSRLEVLKDYKQDSLLDQVMITTLLSANYHYWQKLAIRFNHRYYYPFGNPELMRYSTSVSWPEKLVEGKYLVRQFLRRSGFTNDFIYRPKQSFGFPIKYWAVKGALFQPLVDMIEPEYPPGLLTSLQKDNFSQSMLLWNIINLFLFKKMMIENVDPDDLSGEILDRHRMISR